MKKIICIALFLVASFSVNAQEAPVQQSFPRHEWRVGWGDMAYERAVFYNNATNFNYRYVGHFFGEYQYGVLPWLGAGMKVDWSNVLWNTIYGTSESFYNLCFIPEVRFSYFRGGLFTIYSGIGAGILINGGTQTDYLNRRTVTAPVVDLTLVACSVQWGKGVTSNWFTAVDLGGMLSLNNKKEVFMLNSRIIAISIGYKL